MSFVRSQFVDHLFRQLTGLVGRVEDLVVEDGKVEGQTQSDWMCGLHFALADLERILVGRLRVIDDGYSRHRHDSCNVVMVGANVFVASVNTN